MKNRNGAGASDLRSWSAREMGVLVKGEGRSALRNSAGRPGVTAFALCHRKLHWPRGIVKENLGSSRSEGEEESPAVNRAPAISSRATVWRLQYCHHCVTPTGTTSY